MAGRGRRSRRHGRDEASPYTRKRYEPSPDGRRLLFAMGVPGAGYDTIESQLILVQNLFEELERRLPPP